MSLKNPVQSGNPWMPSGGWC